MTSPTLLSPHRRGPLAETLFAAEVVARGGWFYPAIDPGDEVDCMVRSDALYRVQVKHSSHGWVRFSTRHRTEYNEVDLFAVTSPNGWLIIPRDFITSQSSRIKRLEPYTNAWHLLGLPTEKFELN